MSCEEGVGLHNGDVVVMGELCGDHEGVRYW